MKKSKYNDINSCMQVIGCVYQNPSLLDNEHYNFNAEDFTENFHKIIFGAVYNIHALGVTQITETAIEDYLEQRPQKLTIFRANKGSEWLEKIKSFSSLSTFDYYYHRMKKMTLLRMYDLAGIDVSFIYDVDNLFDEKKKQTQEDWLDNTPIGEIADLINDKVEDIKLKYVDNAVDDIVQAATGQEDLFEELQKNPNIGYPMYGNLINAVFRGARLGCFYLRSAPTNLGKSRAMIADACNFACNELYDINTNTWIQNGTCEPSIYITTEQTRDEIQTMMWAFIANVPEDHILENNYEDGELERLEYARKIMERSPLYIKELHDFSLQDIENVIKLGIRKYNIRYICLDYIHSSMKILSEVSSKANVKGLREDNILFMISVRLKDLASEYGVFILSSTQLNASYVDGQTFDQNLLRGAKAIADKLDAGMIMLPVTDEDKESLKSLLINNGLPQPDMKISIYKNRRGRYNHFFLWCKNDLGVCKINPYFATSYSYEPIEIKDFKITVTPRIDTNERGAF